MSSDSHHHVKKRNQERELEKRGNTDRRLESGEDDRSQMQTDRDSSQRQAAGAVGGAIAANKKVSIRLPYIYKNTENHFYSSVLLWI